MESVKGYLGIDAGTQGLSAIFTNEDLEVLGTGEGPYDMLPDRPPGHYEQDPAHWVEALCRAVQDLRRSLAERQVAMETLGIGISGQMHGEVLGHEDGTSFPDTRLWCDSRNEAEGDELTSLFGTKVPKRLTVARWLWTLRQQADKARATTRITTPSGWLLNRLTGEWALGVGEASGMFPISQDTLDYDAQILAAFAGVAPDHDKPIAEMLPRVHKAGDWAGTLHADGAALLGLPEGVPVAPPEGDQPASLAGSLIGEAGMVSMSFGTSICANSVGDRPFRGVERAVDHFCAADGKPINMVFQRNGTTYLNLAAGMFQRGRADAGLSDTFAALMPQVLAAPPDCGGVLALPFVDDEPGMGVSRGGTGLFAGLNADNATPGNVIKAALLASAYNLRRGMETLDERGFPRTRIILSGGLTKTPELAQVLADVFRTPVRLLSAAEEGTAWGAAVLARYAHERQSGATDAVWQNFLRTLGTGDTRTFTPDTDAVAAYDAAYAKHCRLLGAHPALDQALHA